MGKLSKLFMLLSALSFAVPAFAQGGGGSEVNWVAIAAGFSMALGSAATGAADGTVLFARGEASEGK